MTKKKLKFDPAYFAEMQAKIRGLAGTLVQQGMSDERTLQMVQNGEAADINMSVPINLLPPILDDLLARGQCSEPARPWLGVFAAENTGEVVVMSVAKGGPAAQAGLRRGDVISDIRDQQVHGLADFYRKVWGSGPAGAEVPMRILRNGCDTWLRIKSADRNSFLKKATAAVSSAAP